MKEAAQTTHAMRVHRVELHMRKNYGALWPAGVNVFILLHDANAEITFPATF